MIITQQAVHLVKLHALLALGLGVYLQTAPAVMQLEVILILVQAYALCVLVFVLLVQVYYKLSALPANTDHFTTLISVGQHAQQVFMDLKI